MRKIASVALGLSVIGLNALADHTTQQRSSCAVLPKYKTVSYLYFGPTTLQSTDTGCGYAQSWHDSGSDLNNGWDNSKTPPVPWAEQLVHMGNDGFWVDGYAFNTWARGYDASLIEADLSCTPIIKAKDEVQKNGTRDGYKGDAVIFDEQKRSITIKNLTAYIAAAAQDLRNEFSTLQFKIFTERVENGVSIPLETIWSAKMSLVNGELLLEGDFKKSDFSNTSNENEVSYALNQITKTISIAEGIDFNSLVVEMSGDSGNLGRGISKKYAPALTTAEGLEIKNRMLSEVNFNFDIINKVKELEINITKNDLNSKIEEATITTFNGELVKSLQASTDKPLSVDVSNLSKGAYFINYLIDGNYYSKKFIL